MVNAEHSVRVALAAAQPEDRDLIAALLSQWRHDRFELEVLPADDSLEQALADPRHDACIVDAALLLNGHPGRTPEESALLRAAIGNGRPVLVLVEEDEADSGEAFVAAGAWDCLVPSALTPPLLARSLRRGVERAALRADEPRRLRLCKMDALGRLAAGVAHDFNNLLTAILGYSEMLRESLDADDPRRQDVDEIQRAGDRASALTNQLLAFGRRTQAQPPAVDLVPLVAGACERVAALAGDAVSLTVDTGAALHPVRIEAFRVEQVLAILASNALDAMPAGGRLRVELSNVDVDDAEGAAFGGAVAGPHVCLLVADTGSGMAPEAMAHLFEPFFTTKGRGRGTGLGLAVVYGVVQQARGHVRVDSEPGAGTTVRIFLPRA
jgi:signal transduction histidine kinase